MLGRFNSGKTHLLSKLLGRNFERGFTHNTLGFNLIVGDNVKYIDAQGSSEPIRVRIKCFIVCKYFFILGLPRNILARIIAKPHTQRTRKTNIKQC